MFECKFDLTKKWQESSFIILPLSLKLKSASNLSKYFFVFSAPLQVCSIIAETDWLLSLTSNIQSDPSVFLKETLSGTGDGP